MRLRVSIFVRIKGSDSTLSDPEAINLKLLYLSILVLKTYQNYTFNSSTEPKFQEKLTLKDRNIKV